MGHFVAQHSQNFEYGIVMSFQIFQDSRLGRRKNNEDRVGYCYSKNSVLMLVADGMGGYEYGEVASQLALQTLSDIFRKQVQKGIKNPKTFLTESILKAHQTIMEYALKRWTEFPRTTIVLCLIYKNVAYWAHAGDSRLYVIRNGQIFQKTHDHCRVNDLLEAGKITAEEAHVHPERNKIYSCLGGTITPIISVSEPLKMKAGDIILLSTDGFWGNLDDATLINGFHHKPFKESMSELLDCAEKAGGKTCDNLSTVALMWEDEPAPDSITPEELSKKEVKIVAPVAEKVPPITEAQLTSDIESAIADIRAIIAKVAPAEPKQNFGEPPNLNFPR